MQQLQEIVRGVLARTPKWIKTDLLKEGAECERAEEAIAAMIANAIKQAQSDRA